ncbi:hypothetical protein WYO_3642 [Methylobacterium sp. GXF4]|uniref:hypothetical protein n=1 Tax=Methylobacterium sp. GXF4 TaxID=1096546 RepID=UPI0002697CCA|nr:hypothetical protein [Methylobacterium sp. GXF4]EIZ83631.1 hypothetical protein WYO_3642 [Methylobacterium sp. GXF4]
MKPHDLTHATDPNGREVVGVRLSNVPERAWLYRTDYERIIAQFGTPSWVLIGNGKGAFYVRFTQPGGIDRKATVARLVAGDFQRTGVRYVDKNPLNLRNANLRHTKGRGGRLNRRSPAMFSTLKIPVGKALDRA